MGRAWASTSIWITYCGCNVYEDSGRAPCNKRGGFSAGESVAPPKIKFAVLRPCDDKQDKAKEEANAILNAYPKAKLIMAICSPAIARLDCKPVPGAAEAVRQSPRSAEAKVIGLGLSNDNKAYVHQGITESVVLWNTKDLGYLTVLARAAVKNGTLKPGDKSFPAGRLSNKEVRGDNLIPRRPVHLQLRQHRPVRLLTDAPSLG